MELSTVIGFAAGFLCLLISALFGTGFDMGTMLRSFVNFEAVLIVVGGCAAATFIAHPRGETIRAFKAAKKVFRPDKTGETAWAGELVRIAKLARGGQIIRLEEAAQDVNDAFTREGLLMVVDGEDEAAIRSQMEAEMTAMEERHEKVRGVWDYISRTAPAWGMIGTLIGLVLMLNSLADPTQLGPKMAIALVTTLYGALISNFVAGPIANKLRVMHEDEMERMKAVTEGVLAVRAGNAPSVVKEKLTALIRPPEKFIPDIPESSAEELMPHGFQEKATG